MPSSDRETAQSNFTDWILGEIEAGRSPVLAIVEHSYPVSIWLFCAPLGDRSRGGVETAEAHRGRGLDFALPAAWTLAVRA